jgi:hypothetical protein
MQPADQSQRQAQEEEQARRKDPFVGDALRAAIKAGDTAALKAMLRPVDRRRDASFTTTENARKGAWEPISNLLSVTTNGEITPCDLVLIEYGIDIHLPTFIHPAKVAVFKEHYPDFINSLGRRSLTYCADKGNNAMLKELLTAGVKPEPSDLELAVINSHAGAVRLLVAAGVPAISKGSGTRADLTMEQIARKNMFFAVLDALGVGKRYEDELKPFREGRPGTGALRYVGRWEFDMKMGPLDVVLEPDGSGFMGGGPTSGDPILWKLVQRGDRSAVEIMQVPGADHPGPAGPFVFPVSGADIYMPLRSGNPLKGVRRQIDSDQLDALQTIAKSKPYTGPTGEWHVNVESGLQGVPPEKRAEQIERFKSMKLTLAKDGSASLVLGQNVIPLTVESTNQQDELKLSSEHMPAIAAKGSKEWKVITLSPPGASQALVFERDES